MKVFEILRFNCDILLKLDKVGIRTTDYRLDGMYAKYCQMRDSGQKVTYIVACLSDEYGMSERSVYNALERLGREV